MSNTETIVNTGDRLPDITGEAAEVISDTVGRFTGVIDQLVANLSWENVLLQLAAVILSAVCGYWLSHMLDAAVARFKPEEGK